MAPASDDITGPDAWLSPASALSISRLLLIGLLHSMHGWWLPGRHVTGGCLVDM
jgi:hypothetical protein